MNFLTNKNDSRKMIFNTIVCLSILCIIYFLHYFKPVAFVYLIAEDSWGEYATFACYLLAFVLMIWAMKLDRNLLKPGYILMALMLFFIGMEEISWGQRLLGIETPEVIGRVNAQTETNLHNVIRLPLLTIFCYVVLIWVIILPIMGLKLKSVQKWIGILSVPTVPPYQIPYFVLCLFFYFLKPVAKSDEIIELLLGVAFVSLASDILLKVLEKDSSRWKMSQTVTTCYLMSIIMVITSVFIFVRPNPNAFKKRFYWMAAINYPEKGLYSQAEELFIYMLNNKQLKTPETLLEYGVFLKKINRDRADAIFGKALEEQYQRMKDEPDQPGIHRTAGKILNLLNKKDQAQLEFQKSLEKDELRLKKVQIDDEKFWPLRSMGETYFEMEDYNSALNRFQEAYRLTAASHQQKQIQEWIDQIETKRNH